MDYAFEEFLELMPSSFSSEDPKVRYMCALVSELAYHHVPEFEVDSNRRIKLIPCRQYIEIVSAGISTNVLGYLRQKDFITPFVVIDRSVVAVGFRLEETLFIGFRGTNSLYDCKINLRTSLVEPDIDFRFIELTYHRYFGLKGGRVHQGFAEEAFRISVKIINELKRDEYHRAFNQILLTGHSLGGAVAAIAEKFISSSLHSSTSTVTIGSPRYGNTAACFSFIGNPPTQIQRLGDIVPFVPPRLMGYSDHPYQFDTSGNPIAESTRASVWLHFKWCKALCLGKGFEAHGMEHYRKELGKTANASLWDKPLTPHEKLKTAKIGSQ